MTANQSVPVTPFPLVEFVVEALEDRKATGIRVLDVRELTRVTDFMVVASGNTARQVRAIADHLSQSAKVQGIEVLSVEGKDTAEWILVDLLDVVVHVMQPVTRELYNLEELWSA